MFSFQIKTYTTTNSSYTWDDGIPSSDNLVTQTTDSLNVSGYAPMVSVEFVASGYHKITTPQASLVNETYIDWDFGDYYNFTENKETTIKENNETVTHTYCMPGEYTVSFIAREMYRVYKGLVYDAYQDICRIGEAQWRWSDTVDSMSNMQTWNSLTTSNKPWIEPKDCIDRYCIPWAWSTLNTLGSAITWLDTSNTSSYAKTWSKQGFSTAQPCNSTFAYYVSTDYTYVSNNACKITVLEKPPTANLYCTLQSTTTSTPASAYLCTDGCVCGSYPLQRIVWDFDDGSDMFVVDRFNINTLTAANIVFNNSFPNDINDPRNYTIIHEYNSTEKLTFYPSISVYSCNTNTSDACSTVFGPLIKKDLDINVVDARCFNNNLFLVSVYNDTTCLHKVNLNSVSATNNNTELLSYKPTNTIKNYPGKIVNTLGNDGQGFIELLKNKIQRYEHF